MKALIATTAAVFLAISGCTTTPRTSTPTAPTAAATTAGAPPASVSPPASPTALGWKDIPAATTDTSDFEVLLSDKKLLIAGGDDPWGPESFAVLGDQILVQDSTDGIITYSDRRRTGRARLDSGDYAEDLLVRGSELYVLQGNGAEAANRKVHVYTVDSGGAFTPVRILPGTFLEGAGRASIHLSGDNVVGWNSEGPEVLLDGPGPLAEPAFTLKEKVFTVTLPGAQPLRIHARYGAASIELVTRDADYAYYAVMDFDADSNSDDYTANVYRVALTSAGTDASYTLAESPSYNPVRQVQVVDGQVYQLRGIGEAVQVIRLHQHP